MKNIFTVVAIIGFGMSAHAQLNQASEYNTSDNCQTLNHKLHAGEYRTEQTRSSNSSSQSWSDEAKQVSEAISKMFDAQKEAFDAKVLKTSVREVRDEILRRLRQDQNHVGILHDSAALAALDEQKRMKIEQDLATLIQGLIGLEEAVPHLSAAETLRIRDMTQALFSRGHE